jgi:biotin carboxylase
MEAEAAKVIGADLFGAAEATTLHYNDKSEFKIICKDLGIPVVEGTSFEVDLNNGDNGRDMGRVILNILEQHDEVIIRGSLGESGMSLYRTTGGDIPNLYEKIVSSGEKKVIIEPFLDVISTPNDQWAIDTNRAIYHQGLADQICENRLIHIGTQNCPLPARRVSDYINETSYRIVKQMSASGYTGVLGIDYIVTCEGIYPVENNARFNGSTFVRLILNQIEIKHLSTAYWKFIKLISSPCTFSELIERLGPLLFDGNKRNSVFPYNCNAIESNGCFSIILLSEDYNHLVYLEHLLRKRGIKRV